MTDSRRIRKAVIPAAGLGTRMLPFTKAVPKEMLPLVNTPVIQYVVAEAAASEIETVILVVNGANAVIQKHFRPDADLVRRLEEQGKTELANLLCKLTHMVELRYVCQPEALGLGHAVACAAGAIGDEAFAVLLPDNIFDGDVPCLAQLMACRKEFPGCVIAGREIQPAVSSRFGVLITEPTPGKEGILKVTGLVEKPSQPVSNGRHGIYGRYLLEPDILDILQELKITTNREVQLTDALSVFRHRGGAVHMVRFQGEHYDVGNTLEYLKAVIAFGLKDPKIGNPLRAYMKTL